MGFRFPDESKHGWPSGHDNDADQFAPDSTMSPAGETTVLMLLEEVRRSPLPAGSENRDVEKEMVEILLGGIEAVRAGEVATTSIDGLVGYIPLEITPENVEVIAAELELWAPADLREVLYGLKPNGFDDTCIDPAVRESETGSAA